MTVKRFSASTFRTLVLAFFLVALLGVVLVSRDGQLPQGVRGRLVGGAGQVSLSGLEGGGRKERVGMERLDLKEQECRRAYPALFKGIDDAVSRGSFRFSMSSGEYQGLVQGRIKDNQLYVLTTAPDTVPQILHQRTAILSQLHRALLTAPSPLPDTPFAFVINDAPKNNSWAFAHPNKPSDYNTWLMPSFAFWSWPSPTLGAFDDVLSRTAAVENATPWAQKDDRAVWRGTTWFNPLGHPTLRPDLIKAAAGAHWADVQALNMSGGEPVNALAIEDFCRYKYVVYTEGVTYSGRLPYHQACESVLLTAPLTYLTHTAWLLRPIRAEDLLAAFGARKQADKPAFNGPPPSPPPALLPTVTDWRDANAVYTSPSFDNLEATVRFLGEHPEVARRIARNQRERAINQGYLGLAAETCYWRALIRAWASAARVEEREWGVEIGERFENWVLRAVTERREVVRGRTGG